MTPEEAALATVVGVLEDLGVAYMVTGSVAASYHGRPRATHDTDIVIDPTAAQLAALVQRLSAAKFYVDSAAANAALRERRTFNAIETDHACKIDLIVRRDRAFSREEFARRQLVELSPGQTVSMVTPEDAVLSKLEWARRAGDSERQIADAAGVLAVNPSLDYTYIDRWAEELAVSDLWSRISGRQ